MNEQTPGTGTQAATPQQEKLSAEASAKPPHAASSPLIAGRYELRGILAKGGMGVVHKGWDHVLKRPVAVKLLLDHAATPLGIKRFDYEAHITGQLQHPSIPPVHDLGLTADGKPFLVMKFIKGQTLAELLKSGEDVNVLGVFEAIAQAIGYAHGHAVIHRDLKPLNVMVGAFGEVQVMDWGLAKFRADSEATTPDAATASTFYDPRDTDVESKTSAGAILGTPAYMPPEQAVGAIESVTDRSDVFGLGGILCTMLTGQPPFVGADAESTRLLAAQGKVQDAFARLDKCGAEPEVIALAKRCLSVEPADRPANGFEVARIVAKLRHDADERAKQAEIGQARSDTRRRVLTWSAAAVVAVLTAGAAVSLVQRNRAVQAEKDTGEQLEKTITAEKATAAQLLATQKAEAEAKAKTKEVEATLVVVQERTKSLSDAYGDFVFGIQSKLENRPGTQDLRRDLLEIARNGLAKILDDARKQGNPDRTLVTAHSRMGDVEQQLGNTLAAQKEYQAAYELAKTLAEADPKNARAQRDLSVSFSKLGDVTLQLGQPQTAHDFYQKALDVCQRLADADPKFAEAQRDLSVSFERLGDVTLKLGKSKAALDNFQKAFDVAKRLADADPKNAAAQRSLSFSFDRLGDVTLQLGQTKEALDFYRKALDLRQRLADADPTNVPAQRDLNASFSSLGDVTLRLGQTKAALEFFQKATDVARRLAHADPKNASAQRHLGTSFSKLGDVTLQLGEPKAALEFYRKALDVRQRLADADSKNAPTQRHLSISLSKIGDVTLQLGEPKAALDFYRKSFEVAQRLADADPKNAESQSDLSISLTNLGDAMLHLDQTKAALEYYQKSLDVDQRLANADPKNASAQRVLSVSFSKLGDATLRQGQLQAALDFYQKAHDVASRLADADPKNAQAQRDLLISFYKIGTTIEQREDYAAAIGWYGKALAVAAKFERPEFFANEVKFLKTRIGDCQANLEPPKRREAAPPAREAKP